MTKDNQNHTVTPITLPMPGLLGSVTLYLLRSHTGITLIDTGMTDKQSTLSLNRQLKEQGLTIKDIDTVICTHYHVDHVGAAAYFQRHGAKIITSDKTKTSIKHYFNNPDLDISRAVLYNEHDVPEDFKTSVGETFSYFREMYSQVTPDSTFKNNSVIHMPGCDLKIIATPGHTEDHVCFYDEQSNIIFLGDHVLAFSAPHLSLSYENSTKNVLGQYFKSLKKIEDIDDGSTGMSSHGDIIKNISLRVKKLKSFHEHRIERVLNTVTGKPAGCFEIATQIFGLKRQPIANWLASSSTLTYLEYLEFNKQIKSIKKSGLYSFYKC